LNFFTKFAFFFVTRLLKLTLCDRDTSLSDGSLNLFGFLILCLTFKICSLIFVTSAIILIVLLTRIKHFQGREGKKEIFVKNLSWNTSDDSIKEYFGKYGNVTRVNILKRDDGKSKGIGFVCFEKAAEAQAAFDDASKIELDGRSISLNWANEKKRKNRRTRGKRRI